MSYSALARKWRPKSFAELKGQDYVAQALMNALARNQLHHAYLFTGTRGVGKTTIARILAKCLNCEQGVVATPCDQCSACVAIDEGRFLDLIEVDAASKTKVEDTRELLDNVIYAPSVGRYKVYLIDEVHMLSGHSFNALLKTLEEPPEHVKFVLATTDPEKIPATVLSRCLNFHLRPISETDIQAQLAHILTKEQRQYEEQALILIAQMAKGSMRDALSLLEQAVSVCQQQVETAAVEQIFGMQYRQYLMPLLTAILEQNAQTAIEMVTSMLDVGGRAEAILAGLLTCLYDCSCQVLVPDCFDNTNQQESAQAKAYQNILEKSGTSAEALQLFYQIGLNGQRDLPFAPHPRVGLEMIVLRMIAFTPATHLADRHSTDSNRTHSNSTHRTSTTPQVTSAKQPIQQTRSAPVMDQQIQSHSSVPLSATATTVSKATHESPVAKEKPAAPCVHNVQDLPPWHEIIEALPVVGLSKVLLKYCTVGEWTENQVTLILDSTQEACLNDSRKKQIQSALSDYLNKPIGLTIQCGQQNTVTPMVQDQQNQEKAMQLAKEQLLADPNVQTIMKTFDATLAKVSCDEKER